MARSRRKRLPQEPVRARIEGLTHDGRGVARVEEKTVFVDGALPGEEVSFRYTNRHRRYDEGSVLEVFSAAPQRVEPRCAHFGVCGGCSLQHLAHDAQVAHKQQLLLDNLRHMGQVEPAEVLAPLTGPQWGYRRKARLGVKYVLKKEKLLVGFRERRSPYLAELERCEVLHPSVGERLTQLAALIQGMQAYDRIAQIEVAVDDQLTALVFRNLDPLSAQDEERLRAFARDAGCAVLLQPGGPDSVYPLEPVSLDLHYRVDEVALHFLPTDFTQVNAEVNRAMVPRALELLQLAPDDRVLDLFCGLGNFTLPLARRVREVVGVEGAAELVQRARENAERNGIGNAAFHAADLTADMSGAPWWGGGFDKVLLDPPRSGAEETLEHVAGLGVERLVYVSCNPATLARDAGILVNRHGFRLHSAGIMDMFPHTAHVESIALFLR